MKIVLGCLKSDLRRAISSVGIWVAVMCSCFAVLQPVWAEARIYAASDSPVQDVVSLFVLSCQMNMQSIALIGGAAAFSCSFAQDWDYRFCRFIILRSGRLRYSISRGLVCCFASYLAIMIGQCIALMALSTQVPFFIKTIAEASASSSGGNLLLHGHPYAYVFMMMSFRSLYTALWAYLALGVSTYVQNRFLILFTPLLGFYVHGYFESTLSNFSNTSRLAAVINGSTGLVNPVDAVEVVLLKCSPLFVVFTMIYLYGMRRRLRYV